MAFVELDLRPQLLERKLKLQEAIPTLGEPSEAVRLLREVDAALKRMDDGWYGVCEMCRGHIEKERLLVDPLVRVCLDCLSNAQQRSLEDDLDLASRIQAALLPPTRLECCGWETAFYYEPAGPVSGDYCDVVHNGPEHDTLMFVLGDVSGKGLSASLLVSHLHAAFHSLAGFNLPVERLMERANRVLCESALSTHYATLICGVADEHGSVRLCNAGHLPALLIHDGQVTELRATGLPLGLFCDGSYSAQELKLDRADMLLLFSDGFTEAMKDGQEYGVERMKKIASQRHARPQDLLEACTRDVNNFLAGAMKYDDLSLLALQRTAH